MKSACWASWESSPVNHAKVNKQTIKNKVVESAEKMELVTHVFVLFITAGHDITHRPDSHIVNKHCKYMLTEVATVIGKYLEFLNSA